MTEMLKFLPFGSSVGVAFWHALVDLKLDVYKLNEDPIAIHGYPWCSSPFLLSPPPSFPLALLLRNPFQLFLCDLISSIITGLENPLSPHVFILNAMRSALNTSKPFLFDFLCLSVLLFMMFYKGAISFLFSTWNALQHQHD